MRRQTLLALTLAAVVLAATGSACCFSSIDLPSFLQDRAVRGSGIVGAENREVSGFSRVTLADIGTLIVEQGEEEGLRIEAEENLVPYLETEVTGGRLTIRTRRGTNLFPTEIVQYYLYVRDLEEITVSGSGKAEAPGLLVSDLSVVVSGSGDAVLLNLVADQLTVRLAGSGDVTVTGEVMDQVVNVGGSGTYLARDMASEDALVEVSGSGSATVQVSQRLQATVSGSGSVRYLGSPEVDESVSGSGSIRQIGE